MEHTPAILLRKIPWSETSLIVTWLTERYGRIKTLVRGARRSKSAFPAALELFHQYDIAFVPSRRSDLHELREAAILAPFDVARTGLEGFYLCGYFAELAGQAAPASQPAVEIHGLMVRAIAYLKDTPASERALLHFEKQMCRALGVHDASGGVSPLEALMSLLGHIPASRRMALDMLNRPVAALA